MDRRAFLAGLAAAGTGQAAPAVAFTARTMEGERLTSLGLLGKPVLLQFWATWCGYCKRDEPAVEKICAEYVPDRLTVIAVNVGESRKKVEEYLKRSPRSPKMVLTADTNLAARFPAQGFPLYVLLDKDGREVGRQPGAGGILALRQLLLDAGIER